MEEGKQIDSAKRKATLEWIDNAVEQVKLVLQKRAKDRTLRQNKGKEPVDIKRRPPENAPKIKPLEPNEI